MRIITTLILAIATLPPAALGGAPQQDTKAEAQLQAAINKETVEGNLKGAIEQYRKLAQSSNRSVAGKALVRMGQCYEKLGDKEARQAYERAIRDFADQAEIVTVARARLAVLGGGSEAGVSARLLWSFPGGRFSPDGRFSVFTDETGGAAIRDVASGQTRPLAKSGNAEFFAFSRDGRQIAFCSWVRDPKTNGWKAELRIIGADGSNSRTLPFGSPDMMAGPSDWSPDGKYILVNRWPGAGSAMDMALIAVDDGTLRVIGKNPARTGGRFSTDGKYILFDGSGTNAPAGPKDDRDIYVMAADGSQETAILSGPSKDGSAVWSPDGSRIFFVSDRSGSSDLWSIRFENGRTVGEPQLVHHGFPGWIIDFTRDGTLRYGLRAGTGDVYLAGLDPVSGKLTESPRRQTQVSINRGPVWSPDGQTLAYLTKCAAEGSYFDRPDIVLRSSGGSEKVLSDRFRSSCLANPLVWYPDGGSLLVRQTRQLQALHIATGATRPVFPGFDARGHAVIAHDGKSIYHFGRDLQVGLFRRDEAGNATLIAPASSFSTSVNPSSLSLSPDGRRLAVLGSGRVRVLSTEGGHIRDLFQPRPGIVTEGRPPLARTVWSPDGKFIYFTARLDEKPTTRLWRVPAEGGEPALVLELPGVTILAPSIHPDGRQIAFSTDQSRSETWELRNLLSHLRNAER